MIGWDEAVDLNISRAYLSTPGFLFGSDNDLSETRLPMFAVALVFWLTGVSSLLIARWMSLFTGALTLMGVWAYGQAQNTSRVGLATAALLAVNPFFLSFAKSAFTEGDIYTACTLDWQNCNAASGEGHSCICMNGASSARLRRTRSSG